MNELDLSSYHYTVPEELIAQTPPEQRGESRLLVLDRATGALQHRMFADVVNFLKPGDCLVMNRTKVVPARLYGKKETGGKVEVLFLTFPQDSSDALALMRPFLPAGKKVILPGGLLATVKGKTEQGETMLALSGARLSDVLEKYGVMPLPPYIKREVESGEGIKLNDRERYQTVYAKDEGSIAAPTAGLHFTDAILESIRAKGITIAEVVLHVGWGTFRPVLAQDITAHHMLPEYFEISAESARAIDECHKRKGNVVAVGTTSVRALESAYAKREPGQEVSGTLSGRTSLFIYPGYTFKIVSRMLTNFHLPHSTPLFMACAFASRERILTAYEEAVKERYRFFSYGDAMLIL